MSEDALNHRQFQHRSDEPRLAVIGRALLEHEREGATTPCRLLADGCNAVEGLRRSRPRSAAPDNRG
jgi:hypothetical protein